MSWLLTFPFMTLVLIAYNLVVFGGGVSALDAVSLEFAMMSGAQLTITVGHWLLAFAVVVSYIEILKSTRTGTASMIDHMFSVLVFAAFLVEFIVVAQAGTAIFLILTLMQLVDVIAGFTVSIATARRDMTIGS